MNALTSTFIYNREINASPILGAFLNKLFSQMNRWEYLINPYDRRAIDTLSTDAIIAARIEELDVCA